MNLRTLVARVIAPFQQLERASLVGLLLVWLVTGLCFIGGFALQYMTPLPANRGVCMYVCEYDPPMYTLGSAIWILSIPAAVVGSLLVGMITVVVKFIVARANRI